MKDYYKILGVRKTASEEEIRDRWIKLMRKFHPDHRKGGAALDEKIKEINEAYQVLKHSSTRLDYDLQQTYYLKKKGGIFRTIFKKLSLPLSLLTFLLILGAIYFESSQDSIQPKRITQNGVNERLNRSPFSIFTDVFDFQRGSEEVVPLEEKKGVIKEDARISRKPIRPSPPPPEKELKSPKKPLTQEVPKLETSTESERKISGEMAKATPSGALEGVPPKSQSREFSIIEKKDRTASIISLPPPSSLFMATDEEVKKFIVNYIECYTRKDVDGFLSLFSLRALQNQKDNLERIRQIYTNFFRYCREVRYHLSDIKIEIDQYAAEVKAYYEVHQVLKSEGENKSWRGNIRWILIKENGVLKILSLDYRDEKSS